MLQEAAAGAKAASTKMEIILPGYTTSSEAQDEMDRCNSYRLAVIDANEGVTEGLPQLVGKAITNPILRSADGLT